MLKKIFSQIGIALYLFVIYLVLVQSFSRDEMFLGAGLSLLLAFALGHLMAFSPKFLSPIRFFWLLVYLPYFIWAMIKANLEIAKIILSPKLKLSPVIVSGKTSLKTPEGRLLLANSITLTPGTLTVDVIDEEFFIHCVLDKYGDAAGIMQPFEKFIKRITE